MNKGDVVVVRAAVFAHTYRGGDRPSYTDQYKHCREGAFRDSSKLEMIHEAKYGNRKRNLWRLTYHKPWLGLVVGYGHRQTGASYPASGGYDDYEPGYLDEDKRHTVVMVQPLHTRRWLRPVACLEEDLIVATHVLPSGDNQVAALVKAPDA